MTMSAVLRIRQTHSSARAIGRSALVALWEAWTAHTLSRAIADVASTSDKNYRDLGLDKAEVLAALGCLREDIALGGKQLGRCAGSKNQAPLTVSMAH
jgi:hypothetical protein